MRKRIKRKHKKKKKKNSHEIKTERGKRNMQNLKLMIKLKNPLIIQHISQENEAILPLRYQKQLPDL